MDPLIEGTSAAAKHMEIELASDTSREYKEIEGTSAAKDPPMDEILLLMDRLMKETADVESTECGQRTHWPKNYIFRVLEHIRSSRKSYFEPTLVSIGPYYHGRENLKCMEDLKIRCIEEILKMMRIAVRKILYNSTSAYMASAQRQRSMDIHDKFLRQFMVSGRKARAYYKEEFDHSPENFVKMLFLDSGFIIRTIFAFPQKVKESMSFLDVHIKEIRSDLLLLNNQIPLFFIKEVYEWFFMNLSKEKLLPHFNTILRPFICLNMPWTINDDASNREDAVHLLDFYWRCSLSPQMYLKLTSFERYHSELERYLLEQIEYCSNGAEINL